MISPIMVVDDAISLENLNLIKEKFAGKRPEFIWEDYSFIVQPKNMFSSLIELCSRYYSLNTMAGYEYWSHNTNATNIGWHIDMDEGMMKKENRLVCPMVSIAFYPVVENLAGGRLVIGKVDGVKVTPKTNRVVFFGPGLWHMVEPYYGNRLSVLINIFSEKIVKNPNNKYD